MPIPSELLSYGGGILTGLLTNVLWDQRVRIRRYTQRRADSKFEVLEFDSTGVDLYPINRWTVSRPLRRDLLSMSVAAQRPVQEWLDQATWARIADELRSSEAGETAYLTWFAIDNRENRHSQAFRYAVTPCDYSECLATASYLSDHPDAKLAIREKLAAGEAIEFAKTSPPGIIKINVALLDRDNHFLAMQRSSAVREKRGIWTVGPNETMKFPQSAVPGSRAEEFFGLAERCLREEVGLEVPDYGEVTISWIGYDAGTASVKVFAQAVARLTASEVNERMSACHSLFEVQRTAWLPFRKRPINDIVRNWNDGDSEGRIWSSSAPLALQELWRMRRSLGFNDA